MITTLREELQKARSLAESGDLAGVMRTLDQALVDLDNSRMVPITEAAELLGVRSAPVLGGLLRAHGIQTELQGDMLLVPLSEVARIDGSAWVQRLRTLDRLHDLSSDLGGEADMTQAELDALDAGRPGRLPWQVIPD